MKLETPSRAEEHSFLAPLPSSQDLLDKNKLLIDEITRNQELKTAESLQRNNLLIRELNNNVTKAGSFLCLHAEMCSSGYSTAMCRLRTSTRSWPSTSWSRLRQPGRLQGRMDLQRSRQQVLRVHLYSQ